MLRQGGSTPWHEKQNWLPIVAIGIAEKWAQSCQFMNLLLKCFTIRKHFSSFCRITESKRTFRIKITIWLYTRIKLQDLVAKDDSCSRKICQLMALRPQHYPLELLGKQGPLEDTSMFLQNISGFTVSGGVKETASSCHPQQLGGFSWTLGTQIRQSRVHGFDLEKNFSLLSRAWVKKDI